jgi:hypothetical protein
LVIAFFYRLWGQHFFCGFFNEAANDYIYTMPGQKKQQQLVVISLLLLLLLSYPIISIFNKPRLVGGIPLLYLYLFFVWLGAIIAIALVIEKISFRKKR